MEMLNRAIEDAADFRGMLDKIERGSDAGRAQARIAALVRGRELDAVQPIPQMLGRMTGENRAEHRARLKRERREAKASKVHA